MRTLDLMRGIDQDRFKFDFCALSGLPGSLEGDIQKLGGTTYHCKLSLLFPLKFAGLLRREDYDIVHSHVHLFSGAILTIARLSGVAKRIAHFRTMGSDEEIGSVRRLRDRTLRKLIDLNATSVMAVSEGAMTSAWGKDWPSDPRCSVPYSTVDLALFMRNRERDEVRREFGFTADSKIIVHVGRMVAAKNHGRLVEIFEELAELDPEVRLLLVGELREPSYTVLRSKLTSSGLQDRVRFTGVRTDVARLLMASDLLLFPSLWEGLPGVVLEASAAGIPTLASNLPGIEEIASHIPYVNTVSLDADNLIWARMAKELLHIDTIPERLSVMFLSSPFAPSPVFARHIEAWSQ